jgi:hypothetical protein
VLGRSLLAARKSMKSNPSTGESTMNHQVQRRRRFGRGDDGLFMRRITPFGACY